MIGNKKITGIILVAGNSSRYGQGKNKNFEIVNGKRILEYSLNVFCNNPYIDDVIIACKGNEIKEVEKYITNNNKSIKIIQGGETRKDSVYNCLTTTDADIVVIHDGARPMIKQSYINECIESIGEIQGVTIGVKSKDTIKITDENNIVINTTERKNTWIIQTPQCFDRNTLLRVHEKYKESEVTDDCMLLEKDNYKVKIIEGDYTNIKITTYEDIEIIKRFLSR